MYRRRMCGWERYWGLLDRVESGLFSRSAECEESMHMSTCSKKEAPEDRCR